MRLIRESNKTLMTKFGLPRWINIWIFITMRVVKRIFWHPLQFLISGSGKTILPTWPVPMEWIPTFLKLEMTWRKVVNNSSTVKSCFHKILLRIPMKTCPQMMKLQLNSMRTGSANRFRNIKKWSKAWGVIRSQILTVSSIMTILPPYHGGISTIIKA